MTVIVAIVCREAIVMASDSQTSFGDFKTCNTKKLHAIPFRTGQVLVGEAGSAMLSGNAIEELTRSAKKTKITDDRSVPGAVLSGYRATRATLKDQNFECRTEDLNRIIIEHGDCNWLTGYWLVDSPKLFTSCLSLGVTKPVIAQYATIGSGSELAEYLLARSTWPEMNAVNAIAAAVYVIEEVKKYHSSCSGDVAVAVSTPEMVYFETDKYVREMVGFASDVSESLRDSTVLSIQEEFSKRLRSTSKSMAMIRSFLKKNPEARKWTVGRVSRAIQSRVPKR